MGKKETREHPRNLVVAEVTVNDGCPFQGGRLHDMSTGGAAILYPDEVDPTSEPIAVGEVVILTLEGRAKMPARVARTFEGGFATKFDFSISIYS